MYVFYLFNEIEVVYKKGMLVNIEFQLSKLEEVVGTELKKFPVSFFEGDLTKKKLSPRKIREIG